MENNNLLKTKWDQTPQNGGNKITLTFINWDCFQNISHSS